MSTKKVSVVVPCYNQGRFLNETLDSVHSQTFVDWECIVINDGSKDSTERVAKEWASVDERFRYFFQENSGVSSARNLGISLANGEFILPLDADDKIAPEYLHLALKKFDEDRKNKLVYCKARKFGSVESEWDLPAFSMKGLASNNMIFCSAIFRKDDWSKVGGYDSHMIAGFEDWEFWIAILKKGGKVERLDYFGFFYRIKDESRTKALGQVDKDELFKYMSVKHADFFVDQFGSFFSLRSRLAEVENSYKEKLRSEKFVLDLFFYKFFRFTLFGKYKP